MDQIYVRLLDEGIDVWRPVAATALPDGTYILVTTPVPDDEQWEFPPGSRVVVEKRSFEDNAATDLVAVRLFVDPGSRQ
jgi:hypothetical protein